MFKAMFKGYSERIMLDNTLLLNEAKIKRPKEVAINLAAFDVKLDAQLTDPVFKTAYDRNLALLQAAIAPQA